MEEVRRAYASLKVLFNQARLRLLVLFKLM